jgi:Ca2+-binding RTX toxin-like protein
MRLRRVLQISFFGMLGLILLSIGTASTNSNSVPPTQLGVNTQGINANDVKPAECASINLTAILICPPDCTGTSANELILGSAGADTIRGKNGTDCILGGGGDDVLRGNGGPNDVCIGGPGDDVITLCENQYP